MAIERKTMLMAAAAMIVLWPVLDATAAAGQSRRKPAPTAKAKPKPATSSVAPTPAAKPVPQAAPVAAVPGGTDPEPIGNIADWFPVDSYPPQARALGMEGRTEFALDVDALGRITQCRILQTSGSELLDSATCTQAIINGRFRPGRDASGKAAPRAWHSAMRWKLTQGSDPEQ